MEIILPGIDNDSIAQGLRSLTHILHTKGLGELAQGLLGGEYGYGVDFENEVFMMHHFCWCEQENCPWCMNCTCADDAYLYHVNGSPVSFEEFCRSLDMGTRQDQVTTIPVPDKQCAYCKEEVFPAPNFLHKPSDSKIYWYKYIGRGMEITLNETWTKILKDCLNSISKES